MTMRLRLRLFLVSSSIVAAVLATVMAFGWYRVVDFELRRLDERLCSEARRVAKERFPAQELSRLENDIQKKLGLRSTDALMLRFESSRANESFESPDWPWVISKRNLQWAAQSEQFQHPGEPRAGARSQCAFAETEHLGNTWRVGRVISADATGMVAANLSAPKHEIRQQLWQALLLEVPLAVGLTALGAWLLSAFLTRPLRRLREAMKAITPQDLSRRLSAQGEDVEFSELIRSYNTMLERLEHSFTQSSRFSADAAHELKTPLTILRGRIEQMRRQAHDLEQHAALGQLLDEVSRLSAITRKLLLLSQADAGQLDLHRTTVDLTQLLHEMVGDAEMMAGSRHVSAEIETAILIKADQVLLRQLLNNLLVNAVRYSPPNGFIRVQAARSAGAAEVIITNDCEPLAESIRARLFERFFRGEASRSREQGGSGLGLSLALEIARAHSGELKLLPSPINEVRIQLLLPLA